MNAPRRHRRRGYIMVETLVAMTILSISSFAIQRAIYQAVSARREAEQITIARYLLEHLVAKIEMRPEMALESGQGDFVADGFPNLAYAYEVSRIEAPLRGRAARFLNDPQVSQHYQDYIGKLTVRIFNVVEGPDNPIAVGETLLQPSQLWLPEAER
jgi:hypothetical protein